MLLKLTQTQQAIRVPPAANVIPRVVILIAHQRMRCLIADEPDSLCNRGGTLGISPVPRGAHQRCHHNRRPADAVTNRYLATRPVHPLVRPLTRQLRVRLSLRPLLHQQQMSSSTLHRRGQINFFNLYLISRQSLCPFRLFRLLSQRRSNSDNEGEHRRARSLR